MFNDPQREIGGSQRASTSSAVTDTLASRQSLSLSPCPVGRLELAELVRIAGALGGTPLRAPPSLSHRCRELSLGLCLPLECLCAMVGICAGTAPAATLPIKGLPLNQTDPLRVRSWPDLDPVHPVAHLVPLYVRPRLKPRILSQEVPYIVDGHRCFVSQSPRYRG